jgi:hypothetical protein
LGIISNFNQYSEKKFFFDLRAIILSKKILIFVSCLFWFVSELLLLFPRNKNTGALSEIQKKENFKKYDKSAILFFIFFYFEDVLSLQPS